jgi:protein O-mannosyl-transferase
MPPLQTTDVRRDRFLVAIVALAASVAGIFNDFAYDDILVVLHDDRVINVDRWIEYWTTPYWAPPHSPDLYRPIASLLLAIQYGLGLGGPLVFRLVSVALYAVSAVLVLSFASRILPRPAALAAALLFAAHPVHVEAVVQAVNQGEILVAILSLLAVGRYVDRRRAGLLRTRDWLVITVLYALAALTKENGLVLPGLLLGAELFLVGDTSIADKVRALWRGYAAIGIVAAGILMMRTLALAGQVVGAFTAEALVGASLGGRMLTMLQVVPMWLRLLAWPAHLQIDYSPNEIVASNAMGPHEWLGLALLVSAVGVMLFARRRAPAVSFGLFWCAVALFPVSNVVPTSVVLAERTLFLPSVGFLIAACAAAVEIGRLSARHAAAAPRALGVACAALVLLGVGRSAARQRDWRNAAHLWIVSGHDAPRSLRVQRARASAAVDITKEFEAMLPTSSEPWRIHYQLGVLLRTFEQDSAATSQLRLALAQQAHQPDAATELAETLIEEGRYGDAKAVATDELSAGDSSETFRTLERTADSAQSVGARPGTITLHLR